MWTFLTSVLMALSMLLTIAFRVPGYVIRQILWVPPFLISTILSAIVGIFAGPFAMALVDFLAWPIVKVRWYLEEKKMEDEKLAKKYKKHLTK